MIRIQDIADRVGVSRTTVSNVLHGNTKKVSQETIQKISEILDEEGYVPDRTTRVFAKKSSKIIGLVLGFDAAHGVHALRDSFVAEFLASVEVNAEKRDHYVMLINGEKIQKVAEIASRWNIDGLIILGFSEKKYYALKKLLNKHIVLVDTYPEESYGFVNVGIDDYSGGEQIGRYLAQNGHTKALFVAETDMDSDYYRWLGFKKAMEDYGSFCTKSRYIIVPGEPDLRNAFLKVHLPRFLEAGAIAFSSDSIAIQSIVFLQDQGVRIPDDISVTGFDDNLYADLLRPRLTTIHQDIFQKAKMSVELLLKMIQNQPLEKFDYKNPVQLICRDSVKNINKT